MAQISLFNIFVLAMAASVVWYFFNAMRAREMATAVAREYCKQSDLQFLDGTVGLRTVSISFDTGKLQLRRRYEFHYSQSDHARNIGLIILNGDNVENFVLQQNGSASGGTTLKA